MGHRTAAEGRRVLVCAPFGPDQATLDRLLRQDGYEAVACRDLAAVASHLRGPAAAEVGAALLTEEALAGPGSESWPGSRLGPGPGPGSASASGSESAAGRDRLEEALAAQPPWSDVPFVVLSASRAGRLRQPDSVRDRLPPALAGALVLERPLSRRSLLSAVALALRERQRQFEVRDRLGELVAGRAALAESEARFEAIADSVDQMIWSTRPDGFHDYYNRRWYEFTGVPPGSTDGEGWNGLFHPDDQERAWAVWRRSLASGEAYRIEYRLRHRDGRYRWVLGRAQAVRDEAGRIVRWYGTCTDIEDIVAAREVLAQSRAELEGLVARRTADLEAEIARRDEAEAALRQAQKMEAVGQLTGGLAHDFNNLLAGISGSLELMARRLEEGRADGIGRYIDVAQDAARRASALTHRLLAFSRRQTLDPAVTDLGALARGLEELIRRTVGPAIALEVRAPAGLWASRVDASQLENALLNLCINARDAMPGGGRIVVEARNRPLDARAAAARDMSPGDYVLVSVSDTGTGMTPEVAARAFDPFFTTKPLGQGTGLGLSMIYGFARQSGGQARIASRLGEGTTVSLYLPRHREEGRPEAAASAGAAVGPPRDVLRPGAVVLVVDDEPSVRVVVADLLAGLGCTAVEAADGAEGLAVLRSGRPVDLLVTDVGLPGGINGRQLADAARALRPGLGVLLVTGYAEAAVMGTGRLPPGMQVMTKPFAADDLAARVRALLDGAG